jgi:hypothetical protein
MNHDSEDMALGLTILLAVIAVWPVLGFWVASRKNRGAILGCLIGMFLGPLGILILFFIPYHWTTTAEEYRYLCSLANPSPKQWKRREEIAREHTKHADNHKEMYHTLEV